LPSALADGQESFFFSGFSPSSVDIAIYLLSCRAKARSLIVALPSAKADGNTKRKFFFPSSAKAADSFSLKLTAILKGTSFFFAS
jgi:hypothetical protein